MRTVWKWEAIVGEPNVVRMPADAQIVLVAAQDKHLGRVAFWAEVDDRAPMERRTFIVAATGQPIPAGLTHRGSAVVGPLVWHLYETP